VELKVETHKDMLKIVCKCLGLSDLVNNLNRNQVSKASTVTLNTLSCLENTQTLTKTA